MGATEELLMSMADETRGSGADEARDSVIAYLNVDPDTRKISVPHSETTFGVMTDKDSERKYFRCPRIVGDNLDLSQHKIYISYVSTNSNIIKELPDADGKYWCDDVAVDGDYITFSWKLSGNVFKTPGFVAFKMLACTNDGDINKTRWNTAPAYGTILMTVPDGDDIVERYPDIVTQLLERMDAVETIATEEAIQGYVNEYLRQHPVQLDKTLTDNTKAAPAGVVGELKNQIGNLVSKKQGTENSGKALIVDENGNVICGEAGVSADATLSEEGKAADAKATGDAISELKGVLNELGKTGYLAKKYDFTIGDVDENGNFVQGSGNMARTDKLSFDDFKEVKFASSFVYLFVCEYDSNNVYKGLIANTVKSFTLIPKEHYTINEQI